MATLTANTVYPHITKDSKVMGGRACIEGTRIRVMDIASLHEAGLKPEQILAEYPQLDLFQVYDALIYYHDHEDEITTSFEESARWVAEQERRQAEDPRGRSSR